MFCYHLTQWPHGAAVITGKIVMPARLPLALPRLALPAILSTIALASHASDHQHGHDHADAGHAQQAHVHGVVNVDLALDSDDLLVQLSAPQADITGFEHAPRTDAERQSVADAIATLRAPGLFVPNSAAGCRLTDVDVRGLGDEDDDDAHGHDHDKEAEEHGHSHAKKDHDHQHDDGDEHAGHSDVEVSYQFHCETPAALEAVEVLLEKAFPSIHTINAQLALPQGQFSRTLKSGQTTLTWK